MVYICLNKKLQNVTILEKQVLFYLIMDLLKDVISWTLLRPSIHVDQLALDTIWCITRIDNFFEGFNVYEVVLSHIASIRLVEKGLWDLVSLVSI